jgi:hypothetical protein
MFRERKNIIPKEDFRKHMYKRKQTKVYAFKRWNRGEYIYRKGKREWLRRGKQGT